MRQRSRTVTVVAWILQILMAAEFLLAGGVKLAGVQAMVQMFDTIGLGQWLRYATGAIECASALMLLVPSLAFFGASLLVCTMIGATVAHLTMLHTSPVAVIVLLLLVAPIAWLRYPETKN